MRALAALVAVGILCAAGCGDSAPPDGVAPPDNRQIVDPGNAPARGPADAPVVMVEFGDFECPYCGEEEPVVQRLLADYPDQVRFVFKQFPLSFHAYAEIAAEASLAADAQGQFWAYHDALYAHQDALARTDLEQYATDLGLNLDTFRAALDDHTYIPAIQADIQQGYAVGVGGTPTFFINGRMAVGAQPYDVLKQVIDEELAAAGF